MCRAEAKKCPVFEKILLPEYHSNDIENCLVLFLVRPIRFSNLPGSNRPFLPVEMGVFLQESTFRKPAKTSENAKQDFPLFSFLAPMTFECVLVLLGEWNPPE